MDFATVQWARTWSAHLNPFLSLEADECARLARLLAELSKLQAQSTPPTEAQLQVILQHLHTKRLDLLEAVKGGLMVHFSGGGFEYERFLIRADGRVPNHKYEGKRAA